MGFEQMLMKSAQGLRKLLFKDVKQIKCYASLHIDHREATPRVPVTLHIIVGDGLNVAVDLNKELSFTAPRGGIATMYFYKNKRGSAFLMWVGGWSHVSARNVLTLRPER